MMQSQSTIKRHADLVDRMGDALGVDLEEKVMEGQLQVDTLTDAVLRCTGCSDPTACKSWLDAREKRAEQTPHYCRNAHLFQMLKADKPV